jgi:hypothetical protein
MTAWNPILYQNMYFYKLKLTRPKIFLKKTLLNPQWTHSILLPLTVYQYLPNIIWRWLTLLFDYTLHILGEMSTSVTPEAMEINNLPSTSTHIANLCDPPQNEEVKIDVKYVLRSGFMHTLRFLFVRTIFLNEHPSITSSTYLPRFPLEPTQ